MDLVQLEKILQPIIILVATLSVLSGLRGVRKQIQVTTYLEYTKRFEDTMRPLARLLRKYKGKYKLGEIESEDARELHELIGSYISIIASEYHLQRGGHIDRETWHMWSYGLTDMFENPLVREVWFEVKEKYTAVRGFERFIANKLP